MRPNRIQGRKNYVSRTKWCGIGHPPPRRDRNEVPRRGDALVRLPRGRGKATHQERLTVVGVRAEFCRKHDRNEISVVVFNDRTKREQTMYWGRWQTYGYALVRGVARRGRVRT